MVTDNWKARHLLLSAAGSFMMLICTGAFAENDGPAASAALRSCFSSEVGGQGRGDTTGAAGQCGISALNECFAATDFVGCLTGLTTELQLFNTQLVDDAGAKGIADLSPVIADMAHKRSVCSEIVSTDTHAQCEFTAELEFSEALLLIIGER